MELSYSFHVGVDKNKSLRGKQLAKNSKYESKSQTNNAIQNQAQLTKADKHNLRKYENNPEQIEVIVGTNNLVEDVKNTYLDLFENARIEFNSTQNRKDRMINNYFKHIADDNKHDLAVPIILEIGDMYFWNTISLEDKRKMTQVFKSQIKDLEELLPNFRISNAVIHYDESSPHMHIMGVPFKEGKKNGMSLQVGKATVFTKESLLKIQDTMREKCIKEFNEMYKGDYTLKLKQEGRNEDINVNDMAHYRQTSRNIQKSQESLQKLNDDAEKLNEKSKDVYKLVNNLKQQTLNKNNFTISKEDIEMINDYIEDSRKSTRNILDTNEITNIVNEYKEDLINHKKEVRYYKEQLEEKDNKIKDLDESNKSLVESNSVLKKENLSLKEWMSVLKDKIYKIKTLLLTEVINKIIPKSFFEKLENMGLFKTERPKEKERTRE